MKEKLDARELGILNKFSALEIIYCLIKSIKAGSKTHNVHVKNFERSLKKCKWKKDGERKEEFDDIIKELKLLKNKSKNYDKIIYLLESMICKKIELSLKFEKIIGTFEVNELLDYLNISYNKYIREYDIDIKGYKFLIGDLDPEYRYQIPDYKDKIKITKVFKNDAMKQLEKLHEISKLMKKIR